MTFILIWFLLSIPSSIFIANFIAKANGSYDE